ncbi:hypothetical protein [Metabacillus sp. Hm71]|uniref:hypothetical protein n=1 Tax=Metabacillus sp. Hm71 TaxID=3450743 RepID=UPI003F43161F
MLSLYILTPMSYTFIEQIGLVDLVVACSFGFVVGQTVVDLVVAYSFGFVVNLDLVVALQSFVANAVVLGLQLDSSESMLDSFEHIEKPDSKFEQPDV